MSEYKVIMWNYKDKQSLMLQNQKAIHAIQNRTWNRCKKQQL